jgi:hypothetical protein
VREARERRIGEKAFFEPETERAIYTFNFSYPPGVCKMIEARGKKVDKKIEVVREGRARLLSSIRWKI